MSDRNYDYIIAGAGLSGLSLAWHFIHSPLSDKRILIADAKLGVQNEKTWCFWNRGQPPFLPLIHKSWRNAEIRLFGDTVREALEVYPYYCIRSGDFRNHILEKLKEHPSIDLLESRIDNISGSDEEATLQATGTTYTARYIFQSCFTPPAIKQENPRYPLIQHFVGWDISTVNEVFTPDTITLMDFDESFNEGIAFIYILPWSRDKALLEYTIFSDTIKSPSFYEDKIELYLFNKFGLRPLDYSLMRKEYGEIPMQDRPYVAWYAPRVLNMGIPGGLTKPSTGYTFTRIQKHAKAIVKKLKEEGEPALPPRSQVRYRAYDLWLLQIMHDHPRKALDVFHHLFTKNSIDHIFRFLGEESTVEEDFKIMSSVPYEPFFKAIWETKSRLFEL